MQLLDSCPLPQAQFVSLSILLQLNLTTNNNDNDDNINGGGGDLEADKSAGPNNPSSSSIFQPQYAVLKESTTILTPFTILPEGACNRCIESLQYNVMKNCGMRDDFIGLNNDNSVNADEKGEGTEARHGRVDDKIGEEEEEDESTQRRRSKVRFHDDTKEGASTSVASTKDGGSISSSTKKKEYNTTKQLLEVQTYKPPSQHLNCALGMTLFYIALNVDNDIIKDDGDGDDDDAMKTFYNCAKVLLPDVSLEDLAKAGNIGSSKRGMQQQQQQHCSGIILLTVGITGPSYDMFGYSSVISNLPTRLRECMSILSTVDTSPKEVILDTAAPTHQMEQVGMQSGGKDKKKKSKGGKNKPVAVETTQPKQQQQQKVSYDSSYFQRMYKALLATIIDDEDGLLQDHDHNIISSSSTTKGMGMSSSVQSINNNVMANLLEIRGQGLTESTAGLLQNQSVTSSGTVKKKQRFTFSRSKKGSSSGKKGTGEYESGDMPDMEEDPFLFEAGKRGAVSSEQQITGMNNAEIVRRTAQQLEVLSLVEDDMPLPKYTHFVEGGGRTPSSPRSVKSPRGGRKSGATGRFGRLPVPSDLAGFEYRPPSQQHYSAGGGGGMSVVSGTASTSVMGGSASDDVSTATGGDDTATVGSKYTVGTMGSGLSSLSSVPTLTKSKRDSSGASQSSRSRFLRKKKKDKLTRSPPTRINEEEGGAVAHPAKPPLFPQQQMSPSQQPVYDPFSIDDNIEEEEEDVASEGRSIATVSTKDTERTPKTPQAQSEYHEEEVMTPSSPATPQEEVVAEEEPQPTSMTASPITPQQEVIDEEETSYPPTPQQEVVIEEPKPRVVGAVSEDESAEDPQSMTENSAPPTPQEEETVAKPTRHLDVGLALNEDLTCEYHQSKLSTLSVEGTVQVRVKTRYEEEDTPHQQEQQLPPIPFSLIFQDHSGHIKALQENKKFVENVTHEGDIENREFTYTIKVPREEEYFPVVRYKCGNSLRPVPIRVQSRVRTQGKLARIALQISSNPQNASDLVHLTIIMQVPDGIRGETLQCNPPGGVWNETKRVVLWCVSELGGGEKFQLQSIFEIEDELLNSGDDLTEKLEFPVLARCQCTGAQLSDVTLEVTDSGVSKSLVQRFRVSHKESNR